MVHLLECLNQASLYLLLMLILHFSLHQEEYHNLGHLAQLDHPLPDNHTTPHPQAFPQLVTRLPLINMVDQLLFPTQAIHTERKEEILQLLFYRKLKSKKRYLRTKLCAVRLYQMLYRTLVLVNLRGR